MTRSQTIGLTTGILALFLWSWNVIISKYLAGSVPPFQISFFRWIIASVCILPFTIKPIYEARHTLFKHWKLILLVSLMLGFMNNFIYQAGASTSAIDMALLATLGPVFLLILSWLFLGLHLTIKQGMGFLITFMGILIVILGAHLRDLSDLDFNMGSLWMLAYAFSFGLYGMLQTKEPQNVSKITLLGITIVIGTLCLLPFFIPTLKTHPITQITTFQWGLLIYLGMINSILGYLFWNIALAKLGDLQTSLMYYILPLFSTIEAYFALNEKVYETQLLGGILVLGGIVFANFHHAKGKKSSVRIVRP